MVTNQTPVRKQATFPPPYPQYSAIVDREPLNWPHNARLAVWVVVSVEHFAFGAPGTALYPHIKNEPEIANYAWRDYGNRVGVWRLFEIFEDLEIPVTVLMNAEVIDNYPRIVEHVLAKNWCILPQGMNNNSPGHSQLDIDAERKLIASTVGKFKQHTGKPPHGWKTPNFDISPETYNLVLESGIKYTVDWVNDEQPYWYETPKGKLLHVPYSLECNDYYLCLDSQLPGPQYAQAVEDQFEQLWDDAGQTGRVMPIALHSFISGQPMRAKYVRQYLERIKAKDQVWITTSDAIYDYTAHPDHWESSDEVDW
jgi:peptidoglycan/xylan/chitin deacetylase (PgdA/CDA1 family)